MGRKDHPLSSPEHLMVRLQDADARATLIRSRRRRRCEGHSVKSLSAAGDTGRGGVSTYGIAGKLNDGRVDGDCVNDEGAPAEEQRGVMRDPGAGETLHPGGPGRAQEQPTIIAGYSCARPDPPECQDSPY